MSHVVDIQMPVDIGPMTELQPIIEAFELLGGTFVEGQRTFRFYGWVGDSPLPEGFTVKDMGQCHHAIRFPDADYEVGLVHRDGHWHALWDYWSADRLNEKLGGSTAPKFVQAYRDIIARNQTAAIVQEHFRRLRRPVKVVNLPNGVQKLVVTVPRT